MPVPKSSCQTPIVSNLPPENPNIACAPSYAPKPIENQSLQSSNKLADVPNSNSQKSGSDSPNLAPGSTDAHSDAANLPSGVSDAPSDDKSETQKATNLKDEATNFEPKATNLSPETTVLSGEATNQPPVDVFCALPAGLEKANSSRPQSQISSLDSASPERENERSRDGKVSADFPQIDTDDTSPELLDSPLLKNSKLFKLKYDSFPKQKGAIKTTLSNASYSFAQSQISKHADSLSSSVPNLTLARVSYKNSKNSFRKLEETFDPSPEEDRQQLAEKLDNEADGFAHFDGKFIESFQEVNLGTSPNACDSCSDREEISPTKYANDTSITDNVTRKCTERNFHSDEEISKRNVTTNDKVKGFSLPISPKDSTRSPKADKPGIITSVRTSLGTSTMITSTSPTTTTKTVTLSQTKTSKATSKLVKFTKYQRSPMILRVGRSSKAVTTSSQVTSAKNKMASKVKKTKFLGVGVRMGRSNSPGPKPEGSMRRRGADEGSDGEDKKKQASLHKMKRERKVRDYVYFHFPIIFLICIT